MEINEIWRGIEGFIGRYEVSNMGRVRSLPKGPLGKIRCIGSLGQSGYVKAQLNKDSVHHHFNIHTLVATAFLVKPATSSKLCVNHIDGNKANNMATNLEWVTYQANSQHAVRTGLSKIGAEHYETSLTDEDVLRIREEFRTVSSVDLAAKYGITVGAMCALIHGKTWKHLPVQNYEGRIGKLYRPRPDFEEAARKVHGLKYDYSQVIYVRTLVPVKIGCPKHGSFEQKPNSHLQGRGCQKCAVERRVALLSKH